MNKSYNQLRADLRNLNDRINNLYLAEASRELIEELQQERVRVQYRILAKINESN